MRRKKVVVPSTPAPQVPVPVTYRYAFNTKEEVAELVRFYTRKIGTLASEDAIASGMNTHDLIIKYADRIKFLESQLTMTAPKV